MKRIALLLLGCATVACNSSSQDNSFSYVWATYKAGDPSANICLGGTPCANHINVSLHEGSAAVVYVEFVSHANRPLDGGSLAVDDSTVLQVLPVSGWSSAYAFLGVRAGQTTLRISYNGHVIETVPASVSAPPESSIPPMLDGGPPVVAQQADAAVDGGSSAGDGSPFDSPEEDAGFGMASDATEGGPLDAALSDEMATDAAAIEAGQLGEPPLEASVIDAGGA